MAQFATRIPTSMTLLAARNLYLQENGLSTRVYQDLWYPISIGPLRLWIPLPPRVRQATALHDLHHVLTGYGADLVGETEISAWEVAAGLGVWWPNWAITFPSFLFGLLVYPRRTLRAFARGRGCRSLFVDAVPYETLLTMHVEELRARLGISPSGATERPARLRRRAAGQRTAVK